MSYDITVINQVADLLQKKGVTISVAESVTSGNLQVAFSLAENATLFFQGGITAYNIGQKCRHLLVEPTHAIAMNCVSAKVSEQMASEACNFFKSDYGVGITGYASPVPEKNIEELFAFLAICKGSQILESVRFTSSFDKPEDVQRDFTNKAMNTLLTVLLRDIENI